MRRSPPETPAGPSSTRTEACSGSAWRTFPPQQGAVAVGFAIPAATATRVANELLEHGRARHAYLGLQPGVLTSQIAGRLGVKQNGVAVYTVTPDGPAAKAGIRPGDVLTAVAGQKIATVEELFAALRQHQPGESVEYLVSARRRAVHGAGAGDRPSVIGPQGPSHLGAL